MDIDSELRQVLWQSVAGRFDAQEIHSVFLSGSVVEGLATQASDFDLYVVLQPTSAKVEGEYAVAHQRGLVEVTTLRLDKLTAIAEVIRGGYWRNPGLDAYQLLLANRLVMGLPVHREDAFGTLRGTIAQPALCAYIASERGVSLHSYFHNALGNLQAGDGHSALFNAQRSLTMALDHILAHLGSSSTTAKWRTTYAKRYLGEQSPTFQRFMGLSCALPWHHVRDQHAYAADVGRFIQAALDHGHSRRHGELQDLVELQPARLWGPDPLVFTRGPVVKSPCARVTDRDGRYFLVERQPHFEISREVLAVWLAINNERTAAQIGELLAPKDISAERAKIILERLRATGVLA